LKAIGNKRRPEEARWTHKAEAEAEAEESVAGWSLWRLYQWLGANKQTGLE